MNYITHTRAAFAFLAAEPAATAQHVSLYVALFQRWNAARFAPAIGLLRDELMADAHLGSRSTYLNCLRDLATWGLLTYYPSQSQHVPSRAVLHELALPAAEEGQVADTPLPPPGGSAGPESGPRGEHSPGPGPGASAGPRPGPAPGQALGPSTKQDKPAESHLKTPPNKSNAAAAGANETPGARASSEQELLSPKVRPGNLLSRHNRPASAIPRPEVLFSESELFPLEAFLAAFADTDFALANLRYYHEKVTNWRQDGRPPRRRDWLATAKQFLLNDVERNALVLAPVPHPAHAGAPGDGYVSARYA